MSALYSVRCEAFPSDVELLAFRGHEALNELYAFTLALRAPSAAGFDLERAIGARATLAIAVPNGAPYVVHGVLAFVEHVQELAGQAVYRATLVPQLWHSAESVHSRVFVERSVPEIVAAILATDGLDGDAVRFALRETYPALPHVCQYQESNLAFVTRWLEREGMYYFFEQTGDREVLVITDHRGAHEALGARPARYFPGSTRDTGVGEAVSDFRCRARALPGTVKLRDYDYRNPSLDVAGSAAVSPGGRAAVNVHGGNFATPADGARLARLKAEELQSREHVFTAHGRVFQMRAGYTFALEEHPQERFNAGYLVLSVEHHGNSAVSLPEIKAMLDVAYDDEYRCDVVAIPATVQFRPERKTSWPRIYGYEMAVVDGAAVSAYAQINADGCYKVKIHFDEADAPGAQASAWVRMLQPHGGGAEGFHFPLRAGTEVMLSFLGGDPDRPVIAGVLPNALTASPVNAGNHTMNVLQSGALNRLEMQDLAGSEHVRLQTPNEATHLHMGAKVAGYNLDASTAGDGQWNTGRNWDVTVGGDHQKHVTGEVTRKYDASEETTIAANKLTVIGADHTTDVAGAQTTHVSGEVQKRYGDDYSKTVDGRQLAHVKQGWQLRVGQNCTIMEITKGGDFIVDTSDADNGGGNATYTIGGVVSETVLGKDGDSAAYSITVPNGSFSVETLANSTFVAGGDSLDFTLGSSMSLTVGAVAEINLGAFFQMTVGADLDLFIGGSAEIHVSADMELHVGGSLAIAIANCAEINVGARYEHVAGVKFEKCEVVAKQDAIKLMKEAITLKAGNVQIDGKDLIVVP